MARIALDSFYGALYVIVRQFAQIRKFRRSLSRNARKQSGAKRGAEDLRGAAGFQRFLTQREHFEPVALDKSS